jgi:hypothetical protein
MSTYFWRCSLAGCSGLIARPPGEPIDCPRCGEPISRDLAAEVEARRAETERRKRAAAGRPRGEGS